MAKKNEKKDKWRKEKDGRGLGRKKNLKKKEGRKEERRKEERRKERVEKEVKKKGGK